MERIEIIRMTKIPDNAMNLALTNLYEKRWGSYQAIVNVFRGKRSLANIYLLATSDNYFNAKTRVMILGKETQGWGGEFVGICPSILELQQLFSLYTYEEKGNGAAFQRFVNWVPTIMDGVSVIPNNIVKIGKESANGHYADVACACNAELPLLKEEIMVTRPNIVVVPISNIDVYNHCLSSQLGNSKEILLEEHVYLRYYESVPDIPFIICPHPQGKTNEDLDKIKKVISEYVIAAASQNPER